MAGPANDAAFNTDWFATNAPPAPFTGANGAVLPTDPYNQGDQHYYNPATSMFSDQNQQAFAADPNAASHFNASAPPGWDQTKFANTQFSDPKYQLGRALSNYEATPENLALVVSQLPGFKVVGPDRVQYPDGHIEDAIFNVGGEGHHWQAGVGVGGDSGAGGAGGSGGGAGAGGGSGSGGLNGIGSYQFQPWTRTFVAPTTVDETNDPGYQARLNAQNLAIQKSAAAKGTLLTGGTLKDLSQFGQDYASNEYSNVYNRALQSYQQDYSTFMGNNAGNLSAFGANLGAQNQGFNQGLQTNYFGLAANNQGFNQNFSLASLGSQNANAANALGLGYAQLNQSGALGSAGNIGNYLTGQGNANAAGVVGQANAANSGLANIGNNLMNSALTYASGYHP